MRIVLSPDNIDVTNQFSCGVRLRDVLSQLGLMEEEVICIDEDKKRLLLLTDRLSDNSNWIIKQVLSRG